MTRMRRCACLALGTALCSLAVAGPSLARKPSGAPAYKLVGSAALVSPGNASPTSVQITSLGLSSPWGAIGFAVAPAGLKLAQVSTLATDYQVLVGGCLGGAPRFTLGVAKGSTTKEIYFYFGRQSGGSIACPTGSWANTGNVATPSFLVDTSALAGGSYSDPYSDVEARYGSYAVKYIDVDAGWAASQSVDIDNTQVNSAVYTYEP